MKNVLLMLGAVAVTFASCKKDYTCECKSTMMGMEQITTYTFHDTKSAVKSRCNSMSATVTIDSLSMGTTCAIK